MYAILLNNVNINFERTGIKNSRENARVKQLEIEVNNKLEKLKRLTPDSCYDYSEFSDDTTSKNTSIVSLEKQSEDSVATSKRKDNTMISLHHCKTELIVNSSNKSKRIFAFKRSVKILDILASILIIAGCIFAQVENEDFYTYNLRDRRGVVMLLSDLHDNSTLNFTNYNLSYYNNSEVMGKVNLSDISTIPLNLEITPTGNILRIMICLSTVISTPLIIFGRYIEFKKEHIYKQNLDISFYKTSLFYTMIFELILILLFPYPNVKSYMLYKEFGKYLCIPYSSIFSALSFIRCYFILKLFKHLTKWTSTTAELVCENYVCKADTKFAFKAFQKENPFVILFVIFVATCVCFGLALRTFELYYWESKPPGQDWNYIWNSMWCIFVSMCTVGYGDFYAKTSLGRIITIIACLIGVYFVSMMMVFMTQKSTLNENEKKAYGLINRLKIRNEITRIQADMISRAIYMGIYKQQKADMKMSVKEFNLKYSDQKRRIYNSIEIIKNQSKLIDTFGYRSLQESLFDVSERIDSEIKEINREVEELKIVNEIVISYSDDLMNINRLLKKSLYATKLLYAIISKKPMFGKLNNVDQSLKDLFEMHLDKAEFNDQEGENEIDSGIFDNMSPRDFKSKFDFILTRKRRDHKYLGTCRTINFFRALTSTYIKNDKNTLRYKQLKLRKMNRMEARSRKLKEKEEENKKCKKIDI